MEERELYGPIGDWLIEEKECQKNRHSNGRIFEAGIGGFRVDILGVRYEIIEQTTTNVIHFHGYAVEVKKNERDALQDIGKLKKIPHSRSRFGIHSLRSYLAFPAQAIDKSYRNTLEEAGIGFLRLDVKEDSENIYVYEELKPKKIEVQGISHSSQHSLGGFIDGIENSPPLSQVFKDPKEFFYDEIKPKRKEYRKKIKKRKWKSFKKKEAQQAFDYLWNNLKSKYSTVELTNSGEGKIILIDKEKELRCRLLTEYFYIHVDEESYRVYGKNNIMSIDSDFEYDNLDELYSEKIIPYLEYNN